MKFSIIIAASFISIFNSANAAGDKYPLSQSGKNALIAEKRLLQQKQWAVSSTKRNTGLINSIGRVLQQRYVLSINDER